MNITRAAMALALGVTWASQGVGQSVYRCEIDGEVVFSQQPCDEETLEQALEREPMPDPQSEPVEPIRLERHSCILRDTGTLEAIAEIANDTPAAVDVRITIHFLRDQDIIGVSQPIVTIQPGSTQTVSRLGPIGSGGNRCEYSLEARR